MTGQCFVYSPSMLYIHVVFALRGQEGGGAGQGPRLSIFFVISFPWNCLNPRILGPLTFKKAPKSLAESDNLSSEFRHTVTSLFPYFTALLLDFPLALTFETLSLFFCFSILLLNTRIHHEVHLGDNTPSTLHQGRLPDHPSN